MHLEAMFRVDSEVCLDDFWDIEHCNAIYKFSTDDDGYINKVSIKIKRSVDLPGISNVNGVTQIDFPITLSFAMSECKLLAEELDNAISVMSACGYIHINYDEPKFDFLPENEEEKASLKLFNFSTAYSKRKYPALQFDMIARSIFFARDIENLKISLQFYKNYKHHFDLRNFRYSFYESYFLLEFMFGNGETKNNRVRDEFLKNETLKTAIGKALFSLLIESTIPSV